MGETWPRPDGCASDRPQTRGAHSDTPALAAERTTPCLRTCDAAHAQCSEPTCETGRTAAWPSLCGGGGIMGRAQRHGRARRRAHGAGRSAYERVIRAYGRAVQLPAIPGGLAVVRVRPNGREGGPARTTAHGHPDPRMRDTHNGAAAGGGQRTADSGKARQGKVRQGKANRANAATLAGVQCGLADPQCALSGHPMRVRDGPRALPAIRYGLARATLRNAGPWLARSRATHAHSRPSGTVSRAPEAA